VEPGGDVLRHAFYHSVQGLRRGVAHLRRIDHMMIYILIARLNTPAREF